MVEEGGDDCALGMRNATNECAESVDSWDEKSKVGLAERRVLHRLFYADMGTHRAPGAFVSFPSVIQWG